MTLPRLDNAPLADRARAAILQAIVQKRFSDRLPSEDVLAEMLDVSRTTIRTALHTLEQEGIITRRRAIGTTINAHVKPSALALQRLVGFDGLLAEQGYDVRVESSWTRAAPPGDVVVLFDVPPDEDVLLTDKRYFADGALAIAIHDAVPWDKLRDPDTLRPDIPPSMFDFSRQELLRPVDHAVVEIVAVVKRDGNTRLALDEGEAFTRLHERHYTSSGDLVAVSVIDADNAFVRFEVFRRR